MFMSNYMNFNYHLFIGFITIFIYFFPYFFERKEVKYV